MKNRLSLRPLSSVVLCGALCIATGAYAQNTTNAQNTSNNASKAASGEDEYPDLVELQVFGGISLYGEVVAGVGEKLVDGGVAGIRIDANPSKWFGLELWGDFAQANFESKVSSGVYPASYGALAGTPLPTYSFGSRNYLWGLNPVFNLRPRGSKIIPYVTVGVGGVQFTPTDTAKGLARATTTDALYHTGNLNDNLQVMLNYGGGIKWHFTDHFGMNIDARGLLSRNATFDLPNYNDGGIYIPAKQKMNGLQATVGLVFYFGQSKCPPMPAAPPPPAPLPTPTITGAEGTICQGKPVNLHANITGPPNHTLQYQWSVNGQTQGSNSPDFAFTPNNTGSFTVQVTVTDTTPPPPPMERPKKFPVRCWTPPPTPPPPAPATASATLNVSDTPPSIGNIAANPNQLVAQANEGPHTSQLSVTATPGPCSTNLTYKWTVSEGSLSNDTTANPTFDASTLQFEGGTAQTKTVTASVTVTDENGRTASQSTTITVTYTPPFVRLDDVVFAKNNTRVNNCGKRILIDDAAPKLASGDYDIVLVGHRDADEETAARAGRRGRRGRGRGEERPLDEQRVLNCAAVLSGGTGTCAKVDASHIRVDWVGTDQTSDARPGLCGTSNVKERRGSATTAADKNRRVEVYLIPRSSQALPPAVKNIKPLPEREVRALGCPK